MLWWVASTGVHILLILGVLTSYTTFSTSYLHINDASLVRPIVFLSVILAILTLFEVSFLFKFQTNFVRSLLVRMYLCWLCMHHPSSRCNAYLANFWSLSFFFSIFCFWPTLEKLPRLNICFPQYFGRTRIYLQNKFLFVYKKADFRAFLLLNRVAYWSGWKAMHRERKKKVCDNNSLLDSQMPRYLAHARRLDQ